MDIFHILILILVLIFVTIITVVVLIYEWSLLVTRAPFVGLPKEVIPEILKVLNLKDDSVMYDLGCGDGRILFTCAKAKPKARYIGVDKALAAYTVAVTKKLLFKDKKVEFKHINFFKQDLSDATHVFVYLFPGLMNSLLLKLQKELKPGSVVVSCDFEFQDKQPRDIIHLNRDKHLLGQRLIIYEF